MSSQFLPGNKNIQPATVASSQPMVVNTNTIGIPIGIAVPTDFEIDPRPNPRISRGKYVRLVTQEYDVTDNDGTSTECREYLQIRKMAACVLPICPNEAKFLLIRQLRYPAYHNAIDPNVPDTFTEDPKECGWLYEAIAGVIEPGDTPEQTVVREAKEEGNADIDPANVRKVDHCFMTPGLTNEEMHIFLAIVDKTGVDGKAGLANEGERIRAKWMSANEIQDLHNLGQIRDAKTLLALYAARVL